VLRVCDDYLPIQIAKLVPYCSIHDIFSPARTAVRYLWYVHLKQEDALRRDSVEVVCDLPQNSYALQTSYIVLSLWYIKLDQARLDQHGPRIVEMPIFPRIGADYVLATALQRGLSLGRWVELRRYLVDVLRIISLPSQRVTVPYRSTDLCLNEHHALKGLQ